MPVYKNRRVPFNCGTLLYFDWDVDSRVGRGCPDSKGLSPVLKQRSPDWDALSPVFDVLSPDSKRHPPV